MALSFRALCELDDLKTELGISGSAEDTRLERLIETATSMIERYCGRAATGFQFEAARSDDVRGYGGPVIHAPKTPVISIGSIVWDADDAAETVSAADYVLDHAGQGRIYRDDGWSWTYWAQRYLQDTPIPGTEKRLYRVTYACGYITAAQDSAGSVTITSSGTTATVSHSSHGLATGVEVTIAGANESAYNGTFAITVVDDDSYTYTLGSATTSPATGTITSTPVRTLPYDLEDACLQLASLRYRWTPRDPTIASEKLKSWSASYRDAAAGGGGLTAQMMGTLTPYRRIS